jgi:hypothetical protein
MKVYIEIVILDNLVMTMLICLVTNRLMRCKTNWYKVAIVSIVGTIVSVVYPLINIHNLAMVWLKVGFGVGLGCVLVWGKPRKLLGITIFFVVTFVFGGAMFGIGYLVYGDVALALKVGAAPMPIWIVVLMGLAVYTVYCKVIDILNRRGDVELFEKRAILYIGNSVLELSGYVDSGNKLYYKGMPVALLPKPLLQDRGCADCMSSTLTHNDSIVVGSVNGGIVAQGSIEISTIAGKVNIPIVYSRKIELYSGTTKNILYNIPIGCVDSKFDGFDILLPPYAMSLWSQRQI